MYISKYILFTLFDLSLQFQEISDDIRNLRTSCVWFNSWIHESNILFHWKRLWYKNTRFSWLSRDWHILLVIAAKCAAMCLIINGKQFVIQCLLLPLLAISPAGLKRISAKIRRKYPDVNLRRQSTRCSLRVKMWLFARRGENRFQLFVIYSF